VTPVLGMPLSELFKGIELRSVDEKWYVVRIIGRLLLRRLEAVHRRGWVHGDVAPDNILFGRTEAGQVSLFLIDFGCARRFPGGDAVKAFWNTVEFASVRAVEDTVREPYDDLESLGYVLVHGIFGDLPWFRWTRGRNNWEETRGKDCERVRQVKITFLRGQWCSLGFEWIQLMKMPLELTKLLMRCLFRPKAEDGLPDYETLAELLGQSCEAVEASEAADISFLTEKLQELAPEWHPLPPERAHSLLPPCNGSTGPVRAASLPCEKTAPAQPLAEHKGESSPPTEIAPEQTRSSLFDFDELDDKPESDRTDPEAAPCVPDAAQLGTEREVESRGLEAAPAEMGAEAASCVDVAAPIVREPEAELGRHYAVDDPERPGTPRTKSRWFDFDTLDDADAVEA